MKSITYLFLFVFLLISCKTKRPEISPLIPNENTREIFTQNPDWNINVATINTFSIPVLPPLRQERISLIGDTIDNNELDYVSIQRLFQTLFVKNYTDDLECLIAPTLMSKVVSEAGW